MTLDEFLDRLKTTQRDWFPSCWSVLRNRDGHCPIIAVGGFAFESAEYDVAARLGLRQDTAKRIMDAADLVDGYDMKLRRRLLDACGLTERT